MATQHFAYMYVTNFFFAMCYEAVKILVVRVCVEKMCVLSSQKPTPSVSTALENVEHCGGEPEQAGTTCMTTCT